MKQQYFTISDFLRCKTSSGWKQMQIPSRQILNHIVADHFWAVNGIRADLGIPMSVNAGYRSVEHERSRGRSGNSQHCYRPHEFNGRRGATDLSFWYSKHKTPQNFSDLAEVLLSSPYKRLAWYPVGKFFHCDYKAAEQQLFVGGDGWEYVDQQRWIEVVGSG